MAQQDQDWTGRTVWRDNEGGLHGNRYAAENRDLHRAEQFRQALSAGDASWNSTTRTSWPLPAGSPSWPANSLGRTASTPPSDTPPRVKWIGKVLLAGALIVAIMQYLADRLVPWLVDGSYAHFVHWHLAVTFAVDNGTAYGISRHVVWPTLIILFFGLFAFVRCGVRLLLRRTAALGRAAIRRFKGTRASP